MAPQNGKHVFKNVQVCIEKMTENREAYKINIMDDLNYFKLKQTG